MNTRRPLHSGHQLGLIALLLLPFATTAADYEAIKKDPMIHWAYRPPVKPAVPKHAEESTRARNPIDAFVLSRLNRERLSPSPEADRTTLLRRLSLDLIGLPPTPEEVDRFLNDSSPDAYDKQVDRLLNSPHFGERWGRVWLDAARYADSDGFEKDKPRFVWHYRDWVVRALNRNLPYDRFILEQIAGDLLPNATDEQRVATGFLRNAMLNEEGGVDPEQFRMDGLFDRMDCIGKSVLALTIQCAQCHDHKFDPISQEDYYRLFAFLNNDHESSRVAYTAQEELKRSELIRKIRETEEAHRHRTPGWETRMAAWEKEMNSRQIAWETVNAVNAGDNSARYYYLEDGSIRASGYAPTQWSSHFRATNHNRSIRAFQIEQLVDPNLPSGGPGRSIRGMAALTEFTVEASDLTAPTNKIKVKFVRATADYSNPEKDLEPEFDNQSGKRRPYGPVAFAIDGKDDTAWGIDAGPGRRNQSRKAVFNTEKPIEFPNGVILDFHLKQNHGGYNSDDNQNHNLGRFRLSVTASADATADLVPAGVREIMAIPASARSAAQTATVFSHWRTTVPEFKALNEEIEQLWSQHPEGAPTLMLASRTGQGAGNEMRETRMFKRGDWLKPEREVKAGVPGFLHGLPEGAEASRLSLARWLVDRKSPTTARAYVNRIWQEHFGVGLLETSEDFGVQSPPPSHPELLDWLAVEFMDRGWDMKAMHKLIVTSSVYRQSSRVTKSLQTRDPNNRLLARGPRHRVDAELIRDIALSASGLLNPAIGGPGVFAPAPDFLFKPPASYGPKIWAEAQGPDRYRRGLYTFRFRSVPYPVFQNFDAPNGDFSCVRRARSNTPLQALTTLNEILFTECSQALASLTLNQGGPADDDKIDYAFRRVLSRKPTSDEKQELRSLLEKQKQRISDGWVNPREIATGKNDVPPLPKGSTPAQLAAYTVVSRVLLNLDETITKE